MKKIYNCLLLFITVCFYSATVGAQTTENFETETAGAFTFSEGGFSFSSGTANFDIENFGSAGAGGSDQYIDNFDDQGAGKIYAISITGGASLFSMQSMDVYVSSLPDGAFPTDDGTITVSGRTGATVVYTTTYNSGNTAFPLDFTADNGFFNIDFSNMPGIGDQSSINVNNIQITLGGAFIYAAIDDFEFDDEVLNTDPPEVQSITLVGSPSSTATSVDFLVTFNEDAVNVDVSDFVTDLVGTSGNISGISGSGSSYTVTVSSITGEGTVSIDLIAGNDIEDTLGNTPSPAFMAGAIFNASRCFIETFESFGAGGNTFTSNGVGFETSDTNFNITFLNNGGASGSQFLDNLGDQGTGKSYSIITTGAELFSVNTAGIYVSSMADGAFPTDDGTLTIEGRLSGSTIYTITKNSGFLTDFTTNNGYNPIDFAANGTINVDELRITIGGAFIYVSLDDFEHCPEVLTTDPPTVQSISLVGNPPASSAAVDFTVIFNEDALNVSIDDFVLTSTGSAAGTIAGIAGTGNNYTVSVSGISGEGTLRLDLLAGTDIEDTDSNTPPPPFNEGEVFLVSLCNVETFEAVVIGGNTWNTSGTPFMSSATFIVDEFVNAGAGNSDRYLDNVDDQGTGKTFSIAITDTSEITMNQLAVYVSSIADGAQPTDDGTLTVVANLDGVMQYTITKNTGFPTSLVPDNGFYLLDFSAEGGTDNSATLIDELVFTIGGSFIYIGVDNFEFCTEPLPMAVCQDITIQLDGTGNASIVVADVDGGSTAASGIMSITVSQTDFTCADTGANSVTLTVTDNNGNTDTCTAIVTVEDNIPPVLTCPTGPINSICGDDVVFTFPTATDNCAFLPAPTAIPGFTTFGTLGNSTYFISDAAINVSDAFALVEANGYNLLTVNDSNENAYITSQINAGATGSILIGFNDIDVEGTFVWQSGQPSIYTNWNPGEPNNVGGEDYTQIQSSGGWNDVPSSLALRYVIEFTNGVTQIAGIPSGEPYPQGTTTNTFYVEDSSGNGVTCSFDVIVSDTENPVIACPANITVSNDPGACSASVTVPLPTVTDNCGMFISGTISPVTPFNFDGDGLIDTPTTFLNAVVVTEDVIITIDYSGDFDGSFECFVLNDPDGNQVFNDCGIVRTACTSSILPTIIIPQATWNGWITTYGGNLTFTLLADAAVDNGGCGDTGPANNFYQLFTNISNVRLTNDFNNQEDASGIYPVGTTTVTFTATDVAGNTAICTVDVTVNDTEAPIVTCPTDIVVNNDATLCSAIVNYDMPTVTDNCTAFNTEITGILSNFNMNAATITATIPNAYPFTDGVTGTSISDGGDDMYDGGNILTTNLSTGDLLFSDNTIVASTDFGPTGQYVTRKVDNMFILVADMDNVADFNINGNNGADGIGTADGFTSTVIVDGENFSIFVKRVYGAGDPSINHLIIVPENLTATQNFVTDTDNDQHQVAGLATANRLYYLLYASTSGGFIDNTATENIATTFLQLVDAAPVPPVFTQTAGLPSGSAFPSGVTTNTFEIADDAGNIGTCSFTVTVNDAEAPVAVCNAGFVAQLDATGSITITGADVDGGSTDNCAVTSMTVSPATFDCSAVGTAQSVTLTVMDAAGNMDTCMTTIMVEDNVGPALSCADFTVDLNASGEFNFDLTNLTTFSGATDACGIANATITGPNPRTCADLGTAPVTITITDVNGNTEQCTVNVTVTDTTSACNQPPVAVCQDVVVNADAGCMGNAVASDFDGGSSDPDMDPLTITVSPAGPYPLGVTNVTLTVSDGVLTDSCMTTITVNDVTPPMITCPAGPIASVCGDDVVFADPTVTDNCGLVIAPASIPGFTVFGTLGNSSYFISDVTATGPDAFAFAIANGYELLTINNSNENDYISSQLVAFGIGNIMNGYNDIAVEGTFEWQSGQPSNYTNWNLGEPNNNGPGEDYTQVFSNGLWNDIESGTFTRYILEFSNGPVQVAGIPSSNPYPQGTTTNTFYVEDASGNSATCSFDVIVTDTVPPMISCPAPITMDNDPGTCGAVVTYTAPVGTDNCTGSTTVQIAGLPSGAIFPVGTTTNTFEITDVGGNMVSCSFDVIVNDVEDPIVQCQDITVQLDNTGMATIIPDDVIVPSTPNVTFEYLVDDTIPFTPIDISASTNTLMLGDDNVSGAVPLGFSFNFFGNDYSEFYVGSNGFIAFDAGNPSGCCSGQNLPNTSAPNNLIAFAWEDLDPGNGGAPAVNVVRYETIGTAPNRILVLEFFNVDHWSSGDNVTAHTQIYEGTNNIEVHITSQPQSSTHTLGVENVDGTLGFAAPGKNASNWTASNFAVSFTPVPPFINPMDNCGIASTTIDIDTFDCSNIGDNIVTVTTTDVNGNVGTCMATVTVEDNIAPVAVCMPFTAQLDASGSVTITGADVDGGSTDNCAVTSMTVSPDTFDCSNVGPNNVTLTVMDAFGNMNTCTTTVTVEDMVAPTAICATPFTVQLDANGMASITVADIDNGSTDACGIATTTIDVMDFTCTDVGPNTVTLTVTDVNGNMSTCTTTVTVEDNVPPVALCMNITVPLAADGTATITAADVDGGSTDACGIATTTIDVDSFDCSNVGPNNVILTVTDVNGNVSTCTAVVTIEDVTMPTIACPADISINTTPGDCFAEVSFPDALALDACGIDTIVQTMGDPSGSMFPVGDTVIEFTATDVNGNASTCMFTITVMDMEPAMAVCQDITVQLDGNGMVTITPADVDGGSSDNCGIASTTIDVDTFDCSNVGPNNVLLTVTDVNGNVSTCTAVVTVEDIEAPMVVCQDITVQLDATGTVTIVASDLDNGSTDNCTIADFTLDIDTFDCSNVGPNTVIVTVTDASGNTATCTATVTVEDITPPELVCMDFTLELGADGTAILDVANVIASNTDACGIDTSAVDITAYDCSDIGIPVTVEVFTQDINGNISSCTAIITVIDALAPVVTCPEDITVDPGAGNINYEVPDYVALGDATAVDNCTDPIVIFTQDPAAGTFLPDGVYPVTITAEDEYGNVGSCTFTLTVESILGVPANEISLATLTMYPNPAKDYVILSNPQAINLEKVSIYDVNGRLVRTIGLQDMRTEKTMDITDLQSAMYMFVIESDHGVITKQILKE